MRTPGHDFDLAAGFLVSEGVVGAAGEITGIAYCAGATSDGSNTYNVLDVRLAPEVSLPEFLLDRNVYMSSSCGVCGKASLDAVRTEARWSVREDPILLDPAVLSVLPDTLRAAQRVFDRTGGLHAAGLFTVDGSLLCLREDVGAAQRGGQGGGLGAAPGPPAAAVHDPAGLGAERRSNWCRRPSWRLSGTGRRLRPSSLAADLAPETGLTLIGFLRGENMNVYTATHRVVAPSPAEVP